MDVLIKGIDSITGQSVSAGIINGAVKTTDVTGPQGAHPANVVVPIAIVSSLAAMSTLLGLQGIHSGQFRVTSTSTVETFSISGLTDAGTDMGFVQLDVIVSGALAVGTKVAATLLPVGTYRFSYPLTVSALVFAKSAAAETFTINGFMSGR